MNKPFPNIILFLYICQSALGIDAVHVSPGGSDSAPGTKDAPVATLSKALGLSRSQDGNARKTIQLAQGTYSIRRSIELDARDNGLVFLGEEGTVLSGGTVVEGWENTGHAIWKAKLSVDGEPRELFVGNQRAKRARFPDHGWLRIEKSHPYRRSGFTYSGGDLPEGLKPGHGLELVFLHDWSISRIPVSSLNHATRTLAVPFPIGCAAAHYSIDHFEKQPRYALEGSLDLLDQPGEWAVKDGYIHYMPVPGQSMQQLQFIIPRLGKLLEIAPGKEGVRPTGIHFKNLQFSHCRWDTPAEGYASGQASMHEYRDGSGRPGRIFIPAAVQVTSASDVQFSHCQFTQLGGSGLWIGGESQDCLATRCRFEDISANGVNFGELGSHKIPTNLRLEHSVVQHCGQQYYGSVGVWIGMAEGCYVSKCEIAHLPYTERIQSQPQRHPSKSQGVAQPPPLTTWLPSPQNPLHPETQ